MLNIGAISSDCETIRYDSTFLIEYYATEPTKVPLIRLVQREYLTLTVHQVSLTHHGIIHPGYQQGRGLHMLRSYEIQVAHHQGAEQIILTHPVIHMSQALH